MRGTGVHPRTGGVLANIPSRLGLEPTTAPRVPTSMETPNKSPGSRSNLDLQGRIVEALVAELERQATAPERKLSVRISDPSEATVNDGRIDLDKLAMVVMGELAGGP